MRRTVVVDDLRELEIRPQDKFNQYVEMIKKDAEQILSHREDFEELIICPACTHPKFEAAFSKHEFQYVRCLNCRSLFVSPRPSAKMLTYFYHTSSAIKYWNKEVAVITSEARGKYVFAPRVLWVEDVISEYGQRQSTILDYHSKYPELLTILRSRSSFESFLLFKPLAHVLDECKLNDYTIIDRCEEDIAGAITAMEVIERAHDPWKDVSVINKLLKEKGFLFITTMSNGFDIQVLGQHAPNIIPLTHLNLLSIEGISTLLSRSGFEVIELSTPGRLDIEMVVSVAKDTPELSLPPWIDDLVRRRSERTHEAFQEFLQIGRLSSHLRLVAHKPGREDIHE